MTRAFANILMKEVSVLLNKGMTLSRFYPLLPMREGLPAALMSVGVRNKYELFQRMETGALEEATNILNETLTLFGDFLHLHDFKPRRMSELELGEEFTTVLAGDGVKHSGEYLVRYLAAPADIEARYGVDRARVLPHIL